MEILIPSKDREHDPKTALLLKKLGVLDHFPVKLFVSESSVESYERSYASKGLGSIKIVPVPTRIQGISRKRQFMIEYCVSQSIGKILVLDDDLQTIASRHEEEGSVRYPVLKEGQGRILHRALVSGFSMLDSYSHGGIGHRLFANARKEIQFNTRILCAHYLNPFDFEKYDVRYDKLDVMEDFYVTLSFLTKGRQNFCLSSVVHEQAGFNRAGGCSSYRTPEMMKETAHKLQECFPGLVTPVEKQYKTQTGLETRIDVRVNWNQAYLQSKR